ncbi:MAG: DAK2 domain-containing protein [Clostridia bacterium]|nr:DAK2 domain-containing protein [Clostridia bacterium]
MEAQRMDGRLFWELVRGGAAQLKAHANEVNDLNVFPIPDGDTGDNMYLTISGGVNREPNGDEPIGSAARRIADGMLLSARGNSGVILSQFFDGIAAGLSNAEQADAKLLGSAFQKGVEHSYAAVSEPTEGTILTVAKTATRYASDASTDSLNGFFDTFLERGQTALLETPEQLPVLKKAGVVDSGGAGLLYIIEGMARALNGEAPEADEGVQKPVAASLDLDRFTEDSELTFGYCTELLLRLQTKKTDVDTFDLNPMREFLQSIGNSLVLVKTGSVVKIHVHTMQPYRVLEYCQRYGEYLTVKIENMNLQHNNLPTDSVLVTASERKPIAIVAVASGEGIKHTFREMGADDVIDGGQCQNPSTDDFLASFDRVNAETILVLPNNSNVILAAKQAAALYEKARVLVVESKTIGDGYAALSMMNPELDDADTIAEDMAMAMDGVVTASVSVCSRDTEMDGFLLHKGQYIGISGKEIVSADNDRCDTACMLADRLNFDEHEICILLCGQDSDPDEAQRIAAHIRGAHPFSEVFVQDGGQPVFNYILILE